MAQYIEVEEAIGMPGLRVVLTPSVPGPWTEAAKAILRVKNLPYIKVRQELMGQNLPLLNWTKQATAPVFVYNDERPRTIWNDQLYLAERLAPNPPLIPADIGDRTLMFGLANELCGENGLGWARRIMIFHSSLSDPNASAASTQGIRFLATKYDYSAEAGEAAPARVAEILTAFSRQLEAQRSRGSRFLIGNTLSALDLYWAAFAAIIQPLPDNLCQMPAGFRKMYDCTDPMVKGASSPQLFAHRDFVYHEYLELPVDM
jgi:glutathione S-transferase